MYCSQFSQHVQKEVLREKCIDFFLFFQFIGSFLEKMFSWFSRNFILRVQWNVLSNHFREKIWLSVVSSQAWPDSRSLKSLHSEGLIFVQQFNATENNKYSFCKYIAQGRRKPQQFLRTSKTCIYSLLLFEVSKVIVIEAVVPSSFFEVLSWFQVVQIQQKLFHSELKEPWFCQDDWNMNWIL